ncbi:MAG: ABC transporter ATP-binding protein/permease, partial [Candidatus Dormibacteraeota bacterium]|nr:ABC transporter ATP-binding protein/permease [Candidatus Dormibacteraeota bacterium]
MSGPADIAEPEEEKPRGLRSKLTRIRNALSGTLAALPRVLRLVWEASPALTIGLAIATIVAGVVPAATAYTTKVLINAVVAAITVRVAHAPDSEILTVPLPFLTFHAPAMTTIQAIVAVAVVQFLIYAISSGLTTLRNVTQQLMQERVTLTIQLLVMEQAARLDLPFFEESASYDLLRRAQTDAANRPVAMISSTFGLLQTAITFATMVALLLGLSPLLALVALVSPIPAFINDTRYSWRGYNVARWASPLRRRMQYLTTLVTTDTFAKEVQLFGLGDYFTRRFRLLANTYYDRQRRLVTTRYLLGSLWGLLTTLAGSITYLYVALQAVAGRLTIGDLTLYTSAASSVQSSIQGLLGGFSSMYEHSLYLSNLYELLATPTGVERPEHPRPMPQPLRGEVVFENVSFKYAGSGAQALENVSFRIPAGQTLAVVGRNGAGKSTLIKLLCRLYDPTEGRILIDGIDIREFDPYELRSN